MSTLAVAGLADILPPVALVAACGCYAGRGRAVARPIEFGVNMFGTHDELALRTSVPVMAQEVATTGRDVWDTCRLRLLLCLELWHRVLLDGSGE